MKGVCKLHSTFYAYLILHGIKATDIRSVDKFYELFRLYYGELVRLYLVIGHNLERATCATVLNKIRLLTNTIAVQGSRRYRPSAEGLKRKRKMIDSYTMEQAILSEGKELISNKDWNPDARSRKLHRPR